MIKKAADAIMMAAVLMVITVVGSIVIRAYSLYYGAQRACGRVSP